MRGLKLIVLSVVGCSLLGNLSLAQVTITYPVPPATRLEAFDTNLNTLVVKASTDIGSVAGTGGGVTVRCREITEMGSGRKEQGIAMKITLRDQVRDTLLIDYDEIPSLLNAIDQLTKLDFSMTPLNALEADYLTRGGCHIAAFANRRGGAFQFSIRDARANMAPIVFTRDDLNRLAGLIENAKKQLDSLHGG